MGIAALLVAFIGLTTSCAQYTTCCLNPYIVLLGVLTIVQIGAVLFLFVDPQKAIDSALHSWNSSHQSTPAPTEKVHDAVHIGRWVLLGCIVVQMLAIIMTLLLKFMYQKKADKYERFIPETMPQPQNINAQLSAKIEKFRADLELGDSSLRFSPLSKGRKNGYSIPPPHHPDHKSNEFTIPAAPQPSSSISVGTGNPRSISSTNAADVQNNRLPFKSTWAQG